MRVLLGVGYRDGEIGLRGGFIVFIVGKGVVRILSIAAKTLLRALIRSSVFGAFLLPVPCDWASVCVLENALIVLVFS